MTKRIPDIPTMIPASPRTMRRRDFLESMAAGGLATAAAPCLSAFASASDGQPDPFPTGAAEHCIFLWLGGGMAQIDTFDPKRMGDAGTRTPGSYYEAIDTAVQGVKVCRHLSRTARVMEHVTAVRSIHHDVIDEHAAAVNRVHTGRSTSGTIQYPSIGSIVAHQAGPAADQVPAYVVVGYPNLTRGPGFLGPRFGYLYLTDTQSGPAGLAAPDDLPPARRERRGQLLRRLRERTSGEAPLARYEAALDESLRLSEGPFMDVFDLDSESPGLRERYGSEFGQRCLLARRLTEAGVRFVEVSHNLNFVNGTGWDTHNQGQLNQHVLIEELDAALATLISDLRERGRLDRTIIAVGTEFGRPPEFDGGGGRGHQSTAFTLVLAGGGLRHQGAFGATDELSKSIVDSPVGIPDFHATILAAMGIRPDSELVTPTGRPVPVTDGGRPIAALFP